MDELLENRFLDLFRRYDRQGTYLFSNFLDLAALSVLQTILPRLPRVPYTLFGGADGCERKMLRLGSEEECGYEARFPISCVHIVPAGTKFAEDLSHRDYLGAVMNLGFDRELTGDIVVRPEEAYLFCVDRITAYITDNLTQVRHTTVRCSVTGSLPEGGLFRLKRQP